MLVNATAGEASIEALRAAGGQNLAGEVLIDASCWGDCSLGPSLGWCGEQRRPPDRADPLRRPELGTALRALAGLRAVEARQPVFAYELQRRAEAAGAPLRSFAVHPGYAATNLQSAGPGTGGGLMARLNTTVMAIGNRLFAQSDEMGALPTLFAATAPDQPGGSFAGPTGFAQQRGHPGLVDSSKASKDPDLASRLWEVSEELTGVSYRFA
jgi:hypothetical protein